MNHRRPKGTPRPRPPSPQPHFVSEGPDVGSDAIDNVFLSKSALQKLHLECYDECVYNDLPQYLVRISDMRLYSRGELWKKFRSLVGAIDVDVEKARYTMVTVGEAQLRTNCKVI